MFQVLSGDSEAKLFSLLKVLSEAFSDYANYSKSLEPLTISCLKVKAFKAKFWPLWASILAKFGLFGILWLCFSL